VAILASAALYAAGVWRIHRSGGRWPVSRTLLFVVAGLGSWAVVSFGFLGSYSEELRLAFTTRIALLLFVVPALMVLGRPVELARRALGPRGSARLERVLSSWIVRVTGNAAFATLFAALAFCVFLTPLAGALRLSPIAEPAIGILVPAVGLLLALPLVENSGARSTLYITAEFLLAFVELVLDAIPGVLMRLNDGILDGVGPGIVSGAGAVASQALPGWWPNPLHDQHLAGDLLWFIAEIADVPILILLFVRWSRLDRRDAKKMDALSDDEMDALTRAHLGRRD
jgi:putative membrane protein